MLELEERILRDGKLIGTEILKVDSFLNHMVDVGLIDRMGREFAEIFKNSNVNKILTVEASGIPLAYAAARAMGNIPMVFAKKAAPSTMTEDAYTAEIKSFTKEKTTKIFVSKNFLKKGDRVLIIDDFLATGEAALGLLSLIRQAGAFPCGVGAAIEKEYQKGSERLAKQGVRVESLAVITSSAGGIIQFKKKR